MKIDNIKDAKPGDWIKAEYEGYPFEGEAWHSKAGGSLYVGVTPVRYDDGTFPDAIAIISIERPEPKLPTEPGSVILDVTTEEGEEVALLFLSEDSGRVWVDPKGTSMYYAPEIVSFTPANVVPE